MKRTAVLSLLGLVVLLLALDATGVLSLGIFPTAGEAPGPNAADLLGSSLEGGNAATLTGRGTKAAKDAEAAAQATAAQPAQPSEVHGGTPGGGVVRGRVVRGEGSVPVPGVLVRLSRFDSLMSYLRAEINGRYDVLEAHTGEDGRFAFLDVTPSKDYVVRARAREGGLAPASSRRPIDLRGRGTVDIGDLTLRVGARIEGRVLDHEKQPAAGVVVTATWQIANPLGIVLSKAATAPEVEATTRTDEAGRFVLGHLEAVASSLFFESPGGAAEVLRRVSLEEGQTKTLDDVVLPGGHFLAGTVAWSDGTPLTGARVFAAPMNRGTVRPTETAADGSFRIDWLPEGERLGLGVLVPGLPVHMQQGVTLDRDDVKVIFPVPGRLEGQVVTAKGGRPVTRFRIHLDAAEQPEDWMLRFIQAQVQRGLGATPFTAEDGAFVFPRAAAGAYTLRVTAAGYPETKVADVVIRANETTTIRVEVPEGNVARGTVQRANGDLVGGARLYVIPGGVEAGGAGARLTGYINDREPDAVTEAGGQFLLPPQTPGRYDVIAVHEDTLPAVARGVDLSAGDVRGIEIRLPPSGAVRGRLLDEKGRPAKGETIYILYRNGIVRTEDVDEEGRFEARGLPVGRCLVQWLSMRSAGRYGRIFRGRSSPAAKEKAYDELRQDGGEHEVSDGGVVEVALRLPPRTTVTGRLLLGGDVPPKGQRNVWISSEGGGRWVRVVVGADGRYETKLLPGAYQAYVPVSKDQYEMFKIEIPDVATHVLDLGR